MNGKIAAAGIEQNPAFTTVVHARHRSSGLYVHAARGRRQLRRLDGIAVGLRCQRRRAWRGFGNAIVAGVDDAADRRRAVTQRGRAANDLDLIGRERIDRHEMVLAEIGRAIAPDAVLHDADAIDVEPANDGPA